MKYIAVLLTCHNRKDKTLQCLHALYKCSAPTDYRFDIYLVDDGCTDNTGYAVQEQFSNVNVIKGDGTLFWNRGMILAWQTAAGTKNYDFYLWLNDDTTLNIDGLSVLLNTSDILQHQSIIVGTTSSVNDPKIITYGGLMKKSGLITPTDSPIQCDYFNGNVVFFPKYVYEKVGMNDSVFHHALGDIDYGLRASKLGVKSYISPGVLGKCDKHESVPTWCNPKLPLKKRWKAFQTPLGQNPIEFFIFEKRHNGLMKALFHYMTNYLRVLCPNLWNNSRL
jgi:GT2 family glycosyltransferase